MPNKYDTQHIKNVNKYATLIDDLYQQAIMAAARMLIGADFTGDPAQFSFAKYPKLKGQADKFFNSFYNNTGGLIRNGMKEEWALSNKKNDDLVKHLIGNNPDKRYLQGNEDALQAFIQRQRDGLKLSDRVWNLTKDFKDKLEGGVRSGIETGKGHAVLAKDLTDYLQKEGSNPGTGVYHDPRKNAKRLTRTETNMAYHASDWERWQQLDFVIGYEVEISNNGHACPICIQLQGKYPKWFKFSGFHPQCMCHATAIMAADIDNVENDPNEVKQVPAGFAKWVRDNEERSKGRSQPYFVRDNFKGGKLTGGLLKPEAMPGTKKGKLNHFIDQIDKAKVDHLAVKPLPRALSEQEIIDRLGGGDKTKGSCSSLAFAYAGNKAGFDVLDFRDGASRLTFSRNGNINEIAEHVGGVIAKNTSDFVKAKELLAITQQGREYYFTCGSHAAIVRKADKGYEYLELQSATKNGFKPLTNYELQYRFGAKKSHTMYRQKYETKSCIIDIDLLKDDSYFRELLGYINTSEGKQIKGVTGTIK